MSENFHVSEEVKRLVNDIISKRHLNPLVEVKYATGYEVGDGFLSQALAVTIKNPRETLDLFVKYALKTPSSSEWLKVDEFYANEIHFYDVVHPTYQEFSKKRGDEIGFRNVPKCYGTSSEDRVVAMENLKLKGFSMFERNQWMDDEHIKSVLRTLAKFHAISFAFKDQDRENYDRLVEKAYDVMTVKHGETGMTKFMRVTIADFLKKLDPIADKEILDKCDLEELVSYISRADRTLDEYSVLTKGDCWCNNAMFQYEDGDKKHPTDVILVDWQLIRPASVVYDLAYFFPTVASEEILARTEDYLKIYHDELSTRISRLGSDPETLYPFRVLLEEWKLHCNYGFSLAAIALKLMLSAKEEAMDLNDVDFNATEQMESLYQKFHKEDEYLGRMKILAKYMIRNGYM